MKEPSESANTPGSAFEITIEWLRERLINEPWAHKITSIEIDPLFGPVSSLGKAMRVKIRYKDAGHEPMSLIVKFQTSGSKGKRENEAYHLLSQAGITYVPHLYGTFGDGNLIIEDLSSTHSVIKDCEDLTLNQARNVILELADLNSRFWKDTPFPKGDESRYMNAINIHMGNENWGIFVERHRESLRQSEADFAWMRQNPQIIAKLYNSGEPTMTHGDVNRENLLFPSDQSNEPILIDWQLSGQRVLPFDLSYFITQQLTIKQRRAHESALLTEYYRLLPEHLRASYSFDRLWLEYRACVFRSMMSAVMFVSPRFATFPDQFERADRLAARVMAAVQDHRPVEAIGELLDRGMINI